MEVLFGDDSEAIRAYLSTPEGLANIDINNRDVGSPLHRAAGLNRNDVFDVLLEFGANVNFRSFGGGTALYVACNNGCIDIVSRLLIANADVNICCCSGSTPLMRAANNNHFHIVKMLTPYADFNISDRSCTVFYYAICSKNEEMIDYVFDYCNDINWVDNNGWSYLHWAVHYEQKFTIELLLKKGIDVNICNNKGQTAREMAVKPEILALIPN